MPYATVRGAAINYEINGSKGPWVSLSPGGRRPMEAVRSLAERIASAGYRVLLHDRRNCGASDVIIAGDESEYDRAEQVLKDNDYSPRRVHVQVLSRQVANAQSDVLGALEEAIAANSNTDFRIRDFAVGVDENGLLNLQIVSEPLA